MSGFVPRHIGPSEKETKEMLSYLGSGSLDEFIEKVIPKSLRAKESLKLTDFPRGQEEVEALTRLKNAMKENKVGVSFLGQGYYDCLVPTVIQRNVLENPGWYTQYTPYQAEISQGRLAALLNFQTMVAELTGMDIANASLLDEGTAAAEGMGLSLAAKSKMGDSPADAVYFIADDCHPQTIAVVKSRAEAFGVSVEISSHKDFKFTDKVIGCLIQSPNTYGELIDIKAIADKAHATESIVTVATDLLALCVSKPAGELGADVVVGSSQRFGVPLGFGGPHAAFFAVRDQYKRMMPGRLIGVSKDSHGKPALRLSLQTREQHIRREKATSNICTSQVLLANMASLYAVYHGPKGLKAIANKVSGVAHAFAQALSGTAFNVENKEFFDTVTVSGKAADIEKAFSEASKRGLLLRKISDAKLGVSFDEAKTLENVKDLLSVFGKEASVADLEKNSKAGFKANAQFMRESEYLKHAVFNSFHSETEFLRYVRSLEAKDLSLGFSMIPLGSCTMKLNATSEMLPVSWETVGALHPFAEKSSYPGYSKMFAELERALAEITGFAATSLQPNAGSQGEYAGLLVIRAYHQSKGDSNRKLCLIPKSAHGTNPASAAMAGMDVVSVNCDEHGNIDLEDLKKQASLHSDKVAAMMVTYPSTHGVFEEGIKQATEIVHSIGAQVYMDGANLNALVGLVRPGDLGADVCHINLHKTFSIPHGGGGPGMGPICVAKHLAEFLPGHPSAAIGTKAAIGPISAAPWGSASILTIPWMYIAMMGGEGLTHATKLAILNANYMVKRLESHYPAVYRGQTGFVAHECILDLRALKSEAGVEVEDVAKRLMDYGFHAPTVSWPVPGTIMIEPTESESKAELDRFCDALIMIRNEVKDIAAGKLDKVNNPLKNAPHTAECVISDSWNRPYSRELAAYPAPWTRERKFWPAVGRVDSAYGDKNLFCACS